MNAIIEGTVGSGKSTLGKFLSELTNLKLHEELTNGDTEILLNKFYDDQTRWSFALQIHFLNERFRMIKKINQLSSGILDRSIYGDKIFAQMLNEDGKMSNEEYNAYETLLDNMLEHIKPPHLMIFLKCNTDTAIKRISTRNRGTETNVPLKYWERLNTKYNHWYENYNLSEKMCINVDDFNVFDDIQRKNTLDKIITKMCDVNYRNNI